MCHVSHVTCHVSHVTCHMSHVTCHVSHVTCHMSRVTCHMSCVTCHMSPFFLLLFPTKWWSLSVEGMLSTGPTPSSFDRFCQKINRNKKGFCSGSKFALKKTYTLIDVILPQHNLHRFPRCHIKDKWNGQSSDSRRAPPSQDALFGQKMCPALCELMIFPN